jgi:hypothetical protein
MKYLLLIGVLLLFSLVYSAPMNQALSKRDYSDSYILSLLQNLLNGGTGITKAPVHDVFGK